MKPLAQALLSAALAIAGCGAQAAVQTLNSSQEGGFWSPLGYADQSGSLAGTAGPKELASGPGGIGGMFSNRAYVSFDLTGQSDPITAATLRIKLTSYNSVGPGSFQGGNWTGASNTSESFGIFDVSTTQAALTAAYTNPGGPIGTPNPAGLTIWQDLGGGTQFGSFSASAAAVGSFIDITLSSAAIAALNASLGSTISFGLGYTGSAFSGAGGLFGAPLVNQTITIDTLDTGHELVITSVPEPSAAWLALPGVLLVLARLRPRA